jgi:predicted lysophospholipase L1 biosynthesis ABC-type transport system permease subunit
MDVYKTFGATVRQITFMMLIEYLILAVVAVLFGTIVGVGFSEFIAQHFFELELRFSKTALVNFDSALILTLTVATLIVTQWVLRQRRPTSLF